MAIALTKPTTGIIQGIPWAIALSLLGDYTGATFAGAVQHGKRPTDKTPLTFGTPVFSGGRSLIPISIPDTDGIPLGRNWVWDAIAQLPGGNPSTIARGSIAVFSMASDPGDLGVGSGSPTPKLVIEINSGIPEINILSDADPEYVTAIVAGYVAENGTSSGVSSINGATGAIALRDATNTPVPAVGGVLTLPAIAGPAGPQGPQGIQGPAGATGPQGPKGDQGDPGPQGLTGATGPKGDAGDQGPQGIQGPPGADGAIGPTGPAGVTGPQGEPGPQGIQGLTGATGPQGPTGATGATGPAGADGKTVLGGSGAPSSGLGTNGDFYLDTSVSRLYGPKTGGAWGSGVSLIGATGATGPTGPAGSADTAAQIRDKLQTLTSGDRLSSTAIQGLFPKDYRINPTSFTGSTSANQTVATMVFPGGTFQDGDRLHITAQQATRGGSTGTCVLIIEMIHSGGTTTLFSATTTASQSRQVGRFVAFEAANINTHPDVSNSQPYSTLSGSVVRTAIDLAQQVTLRVGFTLSNAADIWWLNQFHAEHKRTITL